MITNFIKFNEHLSIEQVKKLNYSTNLPLTNDIFINAVEHTEGCFITDDGLVIDAIRYQGENQDNEISLRTGVFYLPKGDKNIKHYKGGKTGYGGTSKIEGKILIKNPIFVKGATGGKAPETAYDIIRGKGSYDIMSKDVISKLFGYSIKVQPEDIAELLTKYNDTDYNDNIDISYEILRHSKIGNTLRYAVQENIIAHAVRDASYDSVLGYSKRRDGTYFISEIFDVREITYPSNYDVSDIHHKFLN